jgi:hypothetical protein
MRTTPLYFPPQKIPTNKKDEKWYKEFIDGAESLAILRADGSFGFHHKMQVWENLDNDIIDENEIEQVFNPMNIQDAVFPAAIKNYPLSVPKIDLLQGEESKRRFDWRVMAKNEDAYSLQADAIKEEIMRIVMEEIQNESFNEEDAQAKIQKLAKYFKYEYKDLNELYATRTLEYLWRQQDLKRKFFHGFRDALVKGREIYRKDDMGGEPCLVKCDPKNVYFVRKGDSHKIEDADIIIEASYEPIGKVIDEFYNYLKPEEIEEIEGGMERLNSKGSSSGILNHQNPFPILGASTDIGGVSSSSDPSLMSIGAYNLPFDFEGNVRVLRVRWIGRRKIGKLTYFNIVTGDEEHRYVSENYKINKDLGETIEWIWVNEAYEGTRLGQDTYIKMQPREIQMRHFDNPSKCSLGYVGTDYGKSLMSRMEPYQYLYNVYMRRVELFYARYHGPMMEWDLSKKPDEWSEEMWMYYGDVLGKLVIDSFNEGRKGAATGKIAGNFNTSGRVLDAPSTNYVQQLLLMLQYIEKQMGEIAGVNAQRQGQVDNRETVGGVERAVTQSSHITEKWFFIHDETKKRALLMLLDTAKQIWKNNKSKKLAFIMDDMSRVTMDINGADFASSEYDIFITDSGDDMKVRQTIEQLSHAYVQGGGSLTLPIKVLRSDSITAMGKLIEEEEDKMMQRNQELENKKLESDNAFRQAELEDKQAQRELEYYKIEKEAEVKLQIAGMQPEEDNTTEQEKLNLQRKKQEDDKSLKEKDLNIKQQQLSEVSRHNKVSEVIAKNKSKTNNKK